MEYFLLLLLIHYIYICLHPYDYVFPAFCQLIMKPSTLNQFQQLGL